MLIVAPKGRTNLLLFNIKDWNLYANISKIYLVTRRSIFKFCSNALNVTGSDAPLKQT